MLEIRKCPMSNCVEPRFGIKRSLGVGGLLPFPGVGFLLPTREESSLNKNRSYGSQNSQQKNCPSTHDVL